MGPEEIACLNRARSEIVRNLDPTETLFLEHLQARDVLSPEDVDLIRNTARNQAKSEAVSKLLYIYPRKARSLEPLIEALDYCCYQNLIDQLNEPGSADDAVHSSTLSTNFGRHRFRAVGVPRKPLVYIERRPLVDELRGALIDVGGADGGAWIVVHGMCGIGKSVLTSAVLSESAIAGSVFTDVYWLDVGPDGDSKLLAILTDLFAIVDKAERKLTFETVNQAVVKLAEAFIYDCPSALVVLDDVWTEEVLKAFDAIRCRVLMTTRRPELLEIINPKTLFVHIPDSGFSLEEARNALSMWTDLKVEELPLEASEICEVAGGHPFVISLIGSFLRKFPKRWTQFYDTLRAGKLAVISKRSQYKFENFVDAANSSLNAFPNDARVRFQTLAVFPRAAAIPCRVLQLYWNLSETEVEDAMHTFIIQSLASKSNPGSSRGESYHIHVLIHDLLKSLNGPEIQKKLHNDLLDAYLNICGQWDQLPSDGYIRENLPYHLYRSRSKESAWDILKNLPFVIEKLLLSDQVDD